MNPFVVEVVEVVVVEVEVVVVVVVVVVMEDTVMVDADMDADMDADIGAEVMAVDGVAGVAGLSMDGLIAEANPVLIIFSKSLNDHPFSQ